MTNIDLDAIAALAMAAKEPDEEIVQAGNGWNITRDRPASKATTALADAVLALVERVKELEGEFCLRITPRP